MSYLFFKVKLKAYRPYFLQLNKKLTVNRQFKIYVPGNLKMHTKKKKNPQFEKNRNLYQKVQNIQKLIKYYMSASLGYS